MAADVVCRAGIAVDLYDAMPSVGRKFLLAGKGGLNLTHSESAAIFESRFGARRDVVAPWLQDFGAREIRAWAQALGVETFVGTSGRVFPTDLKAAPLLRAWLHQLRHGGAGPAVKFHMRHRWLGFGPDNALRFDSPAGAVVTDADAVVLALGGASWARLGSDGAWVALLSQKGVAVAPLQPSNCGFDVAQGEKNGVKSGLDKGVANDVTNGWSEHFASRFAGQPFKSVAISFTNAKGESFARKGEFVATATGVEGSLIYAVSSLLRDEIAAEGKATFLLNLRPDLSADKVLAEVSHPRGSRSLSSHLKSRLGLDGIKSGLLHELLEKEDFAQPVKLAAAIKALPVTVTATRPLDEAISTAGGVRFSDLDSNLMLNRLPGIFCAGEMLDWEAPTGGYLLSACLASGRRAGQGVLAFLAA